MIVLDMSDVYTVCIHIHTQFVTQLKVCLSIQTAVYSSKTRFANKLGAAKAEI